MSAVVQFRTMGATVGLATATAILNSHVKSDLARILSPSQIDALLRTTNALTALPPELEDSVRIIFARGYNLQLKAMIGFAAAQFPVTLLMWQKENIVV